ncbi:hypothetical protein ASE36_20980 [Rhizobium sp. Root274]|uniref:TfoX/Sxy family protein n=1 Tax=unclassified Rhizobium TaxID=2613769 RepID=UPI00071269A0|nr:MULTISPECIES: TfoX/Sxy family protein [unclassified Rhizobium]KQW26449.1 hypothetical protein ASC71_21030 [Rhizobium sp. Root1240]KRD26420.1 hypothetical protein ASE36_20980 [Rhizobium sp. Root274]
MSIRIESMKNLGPATARMLGEVDIVSEDDLRTVGAVAAYRRLKFRFGRHVTVVALYAMEAAIRGCDWRKLDSDIKDHLFRQACHDMQ